jgi:predicted restriction endonuclease
MPVPEVLVASHIIAWRDNPALRVDPRNGLCLCAIHDKAFDRGLMTISADRHEVILGKELRKRINETSIERIFGAYQSLQITLPERHHPKSEYLEWHRTHYFLE